jgi:type VI secretion system protein ImpM
VSAAVALWGKLPAHGDFVARGLAAGERDLLDDWLSASLADARAGLGERFETVYDQAPPWRFAWRDGDGGWQAGAMAPSMDAVGRRYPLLVWRRGLGDTDVGGAAEAVEALLYDALAGGWDADRLTAEAGMRDFDADSAWTYGEHWWTLGGEAFDEASAEGARPPRLMRTVLWMRDDEA